MRRWKQGLASILAVLMLVSALPATALAVEEEESQAPVLTQEDPPTQGDTPVQLSLIHI